MQQRHDEHRRHIALWVAVGGTMAVIVALWVLILPMQLSDTRFLGLRDAARWNAANGDDGSTEPTFQEVLLQQRRQLESYERSAGISAETSVDKIEELRAKIEAASKRNEAAPATTTPPNP